MAEDTSPLKQFFPIVTQNYIRSVVAAKIIESQDNEQNDIPVIKFKISPEYYQQVATCDVQAPLIGLRCNYDENTEILQITPEQYFVDLYQNKIMRDVAMKQFKENFERHINFITLLNE
ncbi:MAG: hypothetical protein IJZ59_02140 [Alphaproteobacteria bacterium]|nr:hypothetical protein [Alphaproteobacteria bacterium]